MGRVLSGDYLSEDEVCFMIKTSELISSCIDKQHMGKLVKMMDKTVVQEVNCIMLDGTSFGREYYKKSI